jgi:TonB family protein
MKAIQVLLLFGVLFASAPAEPQFHHPDQVTSKAFLQQLLADGVYFFISSDYAKSLLVHHVEPVVPSSDVIGARITGTVIIAFEITKDGKVRHAMAVSGPRMLQPLVLAAVKQWTFRPYMLGDVPTTVATSIALKVSNS